MSSADWRKMNIRLNKPIEPLCKFGPGGDFISVWPDRSPQVPVPASNRLTKVLSSIAEIVTMMLLSSELGNKSSIASSIGRTLTEREKLEYAPKNTSAKNTDYSSSVAIIKSNSLFSGEPKLFTDNGRIGIRAGHKQKHCIRAYRRAEKKRTAFSLLRQGSLFEVDFESSKTA